MKPERRSESCRRIAWGQVSEEPVSRPLAEDMNRLKARDSNVGSPWRPNSDQAPTRMTDAKSSGLAFPEPGRSLVLSPVLVGTGRQAIDDPMGAVFKVAIVSDFHCSVGKI